MANLPDRDSAFHPDFPERDPVPDIRPFQGVALGFDGNHWKMLLGVEGNPVLEVRLVDSQVYEEDGVQWARSSRFDLLQTLIRTDWSRWARGKARVDYFLMPIRGVVDGEDGEMRGVSLQTVMQALVMYDRGSELPSLYVDHPDDYMEIAEGQLRVRMGNYLLHAHLYEPVDRKKLGVSLQSQHLKVDLNDLDGAPCVGLHHRANSVQLPEIRSGAPFPPETDWCELSYPIHYYIFQEVVREVPLYQGYASAHLGPDTRGTYTEALTRLIQSHPTDALRLLGERPYLDAFLQKRNLVPLLQIEDPELKREARGLLLRVTTSAEQAAEGSESPSLDVRPPGLRL